MRFLRIGSSGLHGRAGTALTPDHALRYASALGTWLDDPAPKVALAIDSRISSPMLRSACLSGLLSTGAEVRDYGICPAPLLNHAVCRESLAGALLIGAGHHPAGWNAIMPISENGSCFTPSQSQELLDIFHSGMYRLAPWNALHPVREVNPLELFDSYFDRLASFVHVERIRQAKLKVIADFCNGSGAVLANAFAKRFGLELIQINQKLSGFLPHEAEPRPRSAAQVGSLMSYLHADAGFVLNSDATRVSVVTDSCETLSEEYSFPLAALRMLHKMPRGVRVVTNCCTTRTLDEIVRNAGGILFKSKVGQPYTIDKMRETDSIIAGDGSGSVAFAQGVPAFDAFAVMALILEEMAESGKTLTQLAASLPRYDIIKTAIACPSAHAYSMLHSLRGKFPDAAFSEEDGLRFDWQDGWIHLRASLTEPIVRLIVEWHGKNEAEQKVLQTKSMIERLLAS